MLRGIGSVFSFLTILPSSDSRLETVARHMHAFPLAGIAIGLLIGCMGFGMSFFLDPLLVGLLVVASIVVVTGMHHTDGLADFADGLMAKGTHEKKISAMRDVSTGSGGMAAVALYVAGMIAAVSLASGPELLTALLISEVLAKFSMVLMACLGNSASAGSNSPFLDSMKNRKKLAAAFAITLVPTLALGQTGGLVMLAVTVTLVLFILAVSARGFGGITGDVLGATNELCRLASLMVFVSL